MRGDFGNSNKLMLFSRGEQHELGGDVRRCLGERPQQERTNVLPEMKRMRNRRQYRRPSLRPRSPLGERIALSYCRQSVVNRLTVV